jgi:DNA-binding GntR family transcriptional regulator
MPIATAPLNTRHRTKQEFAYQTLKDAIMRCDLRPNERLIIDDLARRLHVSAIPIREAIQMLQSEGLVVTVPHTGATVAPISPASIQDVFAVLEGLELVASRLVAESGNQGDLNDLAAIVDQMDDRAARQEHAEWADMNRQFHRAIAKLPGLPLLAEMTDRALERWNRVRRFYFSGVLVHRVEQAQQEHHEIINAMRAADLPRLEAAVRQHNRRAFAAYMTYLDHVADAPPADGVS